MSYYTDYIQGLCPHSEAWVVEQICGELDRRDEELAKEKKSSAMKPTYEIGFHKRLDQSYSWMLVPMGLVNMDLDTVRTIESYPTITKARESAKLFMDRNGMILHERKNP